MERNGFKSLIYRGQSRALSQKACTSYMYIDLTNIQIMKKDGEQKGF